MKPHVTCHMAASVDGRTLPGRWRPRPPPGDLYERLHQRLGGQAWLVGRVTGQEFAKAEAYPADAKGAFPREPWFARREAPAWAIVLDADGKVAWGRSEIGGDPILVVLTEQVSDSHLAGLRADGVSYVFAGAKSLDLPLLLEILNRELGVERLLLEGGGVTNGAFLRGGLVDEISLIILPTLDGGAGAPSVFESASADAHEPPPLKAMRLLDCERMADDAVWLRYAVENA
jgi:riboflavin biosynthesis pyrimidine reductase